MPQLVYGLLDPSHQVPDQLLEESTSTATSSASPSLRVTVGLLAAFVPVTQVGGEYVPSSSCPVALPVVSYVYSAPV